MGKLTIHESFSIAMSNYQRVILLSPVHVKHPGKHGFSQGMSEKVGTPLLHWQKANKYQCFVTGKSAINGSCSIATVYVKLQEGNSWA